MRNHSVFLFIIGSVFSVFSQTTIKMDSSYSPGDHFKIHDTSVIGKNNKAKNPTDSTSDNLKSKSKIINAYRKLDSYPATHKYIKQLDNLKDRTGNKYKKLDSITHADIEAARDITLKQLITKSLKSKNEIEDNINNNKRTSTNTIRKNDSLFAVKESEFKTVEKQNPQEKIALDYVKTGSLYLGLNKSHEAIFYFEKGLHIAQEAHSLVIIQQALKGLSDSYSQKADIKKALFYYVQYTEVKDSLLKLKNEQTVTEIQTKYESDKKQGEIQSLILDGEKKKQELKNKQEQIQEQKQFIFLIVLALVLTIVLTITLFRQYRSKKKNNQTLLIQNNKIEKQKNELEGNLLYTHQLKEALKEDLDHYMQAALRKQMNPHFIFNSLNSIQSFILQNDKLSANIYLAKFAGLMRQVLENSQHHLITIEKELEVLKLYIELEEQRFDNKFNCFWKIDQNVNLTGHMIPPLILQPYIENAIWHGLLHKDGERTLTISIKKNKEFLVCTIEDDGIGRVAAMAINKNNSNHESLGTKITQKRIDLINSLNKSGIGVQFYDLSDNNNVANGTKVEITIPITGVFQISEQE
jgi:sensor histidine kinase YesM